MVYEGIVNKKPLPTMRKKIIQEAKKHPEEKKLYMFGLSLAVMMHRRKPADPIEYMQDHKVFDNSTKIANEINREITGYEKENLIDDEMKEARKNHKIFYLVSSHDDCAEDHIDYQGKIYFDNKMTPTKDEEEYIIKNKIQSIQWVTFRPVWMVTRPHCRHYFKALKTDDVLSHSVRQLIRNHRMHHKTGKYEMQTIREKTAEETLKAYRERLAYHQYLYSIHKTETLRKLIEKDKLLIKKWEEYLRKA